MTNAPAVHHPLELIAGRDEGRGNVLVGDEHGTTGSQPIAACGEHLDGTREVVQGLQKQHRVERSVSMHGARVRPFETDDYAAGFGVVAGVGNRRRIEVIADDLRLWIRLCQRDG